MVTTNAARFGVRLAIVVAICDSAALAVLALVVARPYSPLSHRLQLLGWWTWLLLGGAVIAGVIARPAIQAELARDLERKARRELEAAEANRRDFLRVVTHELRTPITSLGALARALNRDAGPLAGDDRAEALALLQSHADHPERLTLSFDAGAISVCSDAEKLRRILTKLLENAGRHSHGKIEVATRRDQDWLWIRVMDRGPGLSADIAARVFEKGFSFGSERGASGLGLWIVRDLAGVLGGGYGLNRARAAG